MSPKAIQMASQMVDFADRFAFSQTVAASPTAATQTTVCTLTAPADLRADAKILLVAFLSFTVGTNGVTATFKIRQTDTSGTTVMLARLQVRRSRRGRFTLERSAQEQTAREAISVSRSQPSVAS